MVDRDRDPRPSTSPLSCAANEPLGITPPANDPLGVIPPRARNAAWRPPPVGVFAGVFADRSPLNAGISPTNEGEPPLLEAGGASKRTDAVKRIRTYGPKREALGAATSAERWGPASHTVW